MERSALIEHLQELERARENLAKQIESSKAALAELDQKIEAIKLKKSEESST